MDNKDQLHVVSNQHAESSSRAVAGNKNDASDMARMGKRQELRRNFELFSIVGFISILQVTWESTLLASYFGSNNGGTAGVIWLTIICWFFFMCLIASMAEMASLAPTAGGQYHWVSEFAPRSCQKPLSFIVGWSCCLGWIAGIPSCAQICTGLVQGMVLLVYPDADISQHWQTTLMVFAFLAITFLFNLYAARFLPLAEGFILILHVMGFLAFLIPMWSITTHAPAEHVFTRFNDGGGWGSEGLSVLVGIGSPLWFFIGPDADAHMSEELKDASLTLPRAMVWSMFLNGMLGTVMLITCCFCIADLNSVLDTPTAQPVIQVVYNISGSTAAACVLGSLLVFLQLFGTITNIAAASRQCWPFARDSGFPFSSWIMRVDPYKKLPVNALYFCAAVSFILAAINFGSDVAFESLVSISNAALIFSYMISVGCIRLKRLRRETLRRSRWSLGKWGWLVNDLALAFMAVSFAFSFFPGRPLSGDSNWSEDINWAIVVFAATCMLAGFYYCFGGQKSHVPPVSLVRDKRWRDTQTFWGDCHARDL